MYTQNDTPQPHSMNKSDILHISLTYTIFLKRELIFTLRNCIFLYFHFPFNWADLFYYIALDATTVSWEGRPNQVLMANISFYLAGKMNSTLAPPRSFFSLDYRHYSAPQCNFKIIYSVIVVKMNIVIWKYYMYLCIVLLTYLHVNMFYISWASWSHFFYHDKSWND